MWFVLGSVPRFASAFSVGFYQRIYPTSVWSLIDSCLTLTLFYCDLVIIMRAVTRSHS